MANQHFGNLGDVWKHLPLAEILRITKPARYWESHAGSASYPLTPGAARDLGVYRFLARAADEPDLEQSAYRALLRQLAAGTDEAPAICPGSAMLAMWTLRAVGTAHLYCDIDGESAQSIAEAAMELGLPPEAVDCVVGDGIAAMMNRLDALTPDEAPRTLLLVDPFHITAMNERGRSSLDLFADAAKRGVMTLLWYCARTVEERQRVWSEMRAALHAHDLLETQGDAGNLWCGQVELDAMGEPGFEAPGIGLCGILCANLPVAAIDSARRRGEALARTYADAALPCGLSGALRYREPAVTAHAGARS